MKVLITGGGGFIGSHIVDALIERGQQVVVIDNMSNGFRDNINAAAKVYEMDVGDTGIADVFEREKPDIVSHQAAQTVITRSIANPVFDARENILASINVILNCIRYDVKRIIFASSGGALYGDPKYLPVDEEHPISPISPYGISKYAVEHYLRFFSLKHGLRYVVLRYSNVYGSRQRHRGDSGIVAIFTNQMLRGERPTIFGSGDKTRDYIHVSDIVEANLLAMDHGDNSIFNIGTGVETTDREMFDALAKILEFSGEPLYEPARVGEVTHICLKSAKAKRELNWRARLTLGEGLSRTVNFYQSHFKREYT